MHFRVIPLDSWADLMVINNEHNNEHIQIQESKTFNFIKPTEKEGFFSTKLK